MKLYLQYNGDEKQEAIHGVDYHKGLEDGRTCGKRHEFMTKNCVPVVYTEEELYGNLDNFVELKSWYLNKTISGVSE